MLEYFHGRGEVICFDEGMTPGVDDVFGGYGYSSAIYDLPVQRVEEATGPDNYTVFVRDPRHSGQQLRLRRQGETIYYHSVAYQLKRLP